MHPVALTLRQSRIIMQFVNVAARFLIFYYPGLEDVEMAASQLTGYKIQSHRLEVYGLCPECKGEEE